MVYLCFGYVNSLRPRPNRRHFADDIFKCIFENENQWISPRISLKFVPKVRINNIPALVQIMAWRRPGDKPLSEPVTVSSLTHICVTRPQWVNRSYWVHPIYWPILFRVALWSRAILRSSQYRLSDCGVYGKKRLVPNHNKLRQNTAHVYIHWDILYQ